MRNPIPSVLATAVLMAGSSMSSERVQKISPRPDKTANDFYQIAADSSGISTSVPLKMGGS